MRRKPPAPRSIGISRDPAVLEVRPVVYVFAERQRGACWLLDRRGQKWVRLPYLPHRDRVGRWWPLAANAHGEGQ